MLWLSHRTFIHPVGFTSFLFCTPILLLPGSRHPSHSLYPPAESKLRQPHQAREGIFDPIMLISTRCQSCRTDLLRSFIKSVARVETGLGNRIPVHHVRRKHWVADPKVAFRPLRSIHTNQRLRNDDNPAAESADQPIAASEDEPLPWYLQENEDPQKSPRSRSERQRLPELPEDRPANLLPILEQVSVQLGMEDMSLLDLRHLDPPPALGGNLIMVLCTARSDKHLHISADRLCRWLRTQYKMRPIADGLLGRNELKMKFRRQARRTKLLSHIGRGPDAEANDQLRSGWICVNIGDVESQRQKGDAGLAEQLTATGFGQVVTGTNLVIQMMTEEKRDVLDLDGLWSAYLERQLPSKPVAGQQHRVGRLPEFNTQEPAPEEEDRDGVEQVQNMASGVGSMPTGTTFPRNPNHIQSRAYHTTTRRRNMLQTHPPPPPTPPLSTTLSAARPTAEAFMARLSTLTDLGDYDGVWALICSGLTEGQENPIPGSRSRLFLLQAHLNFLRLLPSDEARIQHLGSGAEDFGHLPTSPAFLYKFYRSLPTGPGTMEQQHWYRRIDLLRIALAAGHRGYSKRHLFETYMRFLTTGLDVHVQFTEAVFESLLAPSRADDDEGGATLAENSGYGPRKEDLRDALAVLDAAEQRGTEILTQRVWVMLVEAHCRLPIPTARAEASPDPTGTTSSPPEALNQTLDRLWTILTAFDIRLQRLSSFHRLLKSFAALSRWDLFDRTWQLMPAHNLVRTSETYALMIELRLAHGCSARVAEGCFAEWEGMLAVEGEEGEGVEVDVRLAKALMRLIRVAEPEIEGLLEEAGRETWTGVPGREVLVWRRCETLLWAARERGFGGEWDG